MKKLIIWAKHPIMYQTPIFKELKAYINLHDLKISSKVVFGDDLSLKEVYFKEIGTKFQPDFPNLLVGYDYDFLRNYAIDSKSGFFSRLNFGIVRYLFIEKPDFVLVHGYETFTPWLILILSKLIGYKVIWRGESTIRQENGSIFRKTLKNIIISNFFKFCDVVLYSCHGNKLFLEQYNKTEKMFCIPCAVNNSFFQSEKNKYFKNKNKIRSDLNIKKEDFVILFSARFTKRKRPIDLLNAIKSIPNENIVVLFVGDGPERSKMKDFVINNNIRSVFTGFVNQSEISRYYSIANLDIVISEYDPSPKSMNEAMNFDLPIITTHDVGTSFDLVKDGFNGYVIKTGDIKTLSEKINYLNLNRNKAISMGSNSGKMIKDWNFEKNAIGIIQSLNFLKK